MEKPRSGREAVVFRGLRDRDPRERIPVLRQRI